MDRIGRKRGTVIRKRDREAWEEGRGREVREERMLRREAEREREGRKGKDRTGQDRRGEGKGKERLVKTLLSSLKRVKGGGCERHFLWVERRGGGGWREGEGR